MYLNSPLVNGILTTNSNYVSLEIVSDAFGKDANNLPLCNRAPSMGHSDVSDELIRADGNKPECSGDEVISAIKDGIISLIRESYTIQTQIYPCDSLQQSVLEGTYPSSSARPFHGRIF